MSDWGAPAGLVFAGCVAHRRVCMKYADSWRHVNDGMTCDPADPAAGNRICRNCDTTLYGHCHLHFPPCCPGKCPEGRPRGPGGRHGGGRPKGARA